jgi:hypothetical protein
VDIWGVCVAHLRRNELGLDVILYVTSKCDSIIYDGHFAKSFQSTGLS